MKLDPPDNTDRPLIYDGPGDWSALYVDEFKPGRYRVRVYGTGAFRSDDLDLSGLKEWLASTGRTCPALP